ncbi:MAG: RagB/SusD family nutrient uptake outer membrane protein, partial [Bacteroidales bacterium]|nr:RagB/SusD family nutrient uptake outer membrane protein [Bacteroidales bacterium]
LRGFYHFEAWRMWADRSTGAFVPYVDENTDHFTLTNTEDIRPYITEDLTAGTQLPNDMKQVGRFNRTVSQVFLAKAQMQMYGDYAAALTLLADVEANGTNPAGQKADLEPRYGDIFDIENRNGIESIYTVQYSVNDGSGGWNGGMGEVLNFPYKSHESPAGCCGFFQPTQDFVNSFRTNASGLPFLDTYNDEKVTSDQGLAVTDPFTEYAGQVDPRLDWAVGRRGIPYWDWGEHTGTDWIRDQAFAGPYSPKKQVYKKSQEGTYTEVGSWTSGFTANGYRMIRYADVLLLKAECEAMSGSDDLGLGEVNAIRIRAANPDGFIKDPDRTYAANYVIGTYPASQFADQESAMKAIKFERKLELGQEGHRYYDLQRWGDVQSELNRILEYEKTMEWGRLHYGNVTVGPEDVNFPIPQNQIDLSNGNLVQNR